MTRRSQIDRDGNASWIRMHSTLCTLERNFWKIFPIPSHQFYCSLPLLYLLMYLDYEYHYLIEHLIKCNFSTLEYLFSSSLGLCYVRKFCSSSVSINVTESLFFIQWASSWPFLRKSQNSTYINSSPTMFGLIAWLKPILLFGWRSFLSLFFLVSYFLGPSGIFAPSESWLRTQSCP